LNRRSTKKPPRASSLRTVIETLETRAMLASVGPESWSVPGLAPAPLGTGALFSSGVILTCSSPAPGPSGTASPPAPAARTGGTTSGGDLWDSYSAGFGAGGSTSGSTGGVSTNGPALSSQYNGASGAGGQGNGTGGTLSNADLWRMYWSGAGAGSSSSHSDEGSLADDPTISAQYTGGSGVGRITPLVYNPESDGPPVFQSGVWMGDDGSVQFVQTADTGNQGTGEGDASENNGEATSKSGGGLIATIGDVAGDAGSYVGRSSKSLILGDWTDEKPTGLSIGTGIGLGVLGVDLPMDIRDLSHTLTHREWSYKWGETLAFNTIGLVPLIGVLKNLKRLKYLDDAGELAKRTDDAAEAVGDAGRRAGGADEAAPPVAPNSGAGNVNAGAALNKKLNALEDAQQTASRTLNLPDGRIRYYEAEKLARNPGQTRGASFVTEWDPKTGTVRQWMESYDQAGNVVRVHPKTLNGQDMTSPHYPPTGKELGQ